MWITFENTNLSPQQLETGAVTFYEIWYLKPKDMTFSMCSEVILASHLSWSKVQEGGLGMRWHCAADSANESESYWVSPMVLETQHHPGIRLCTHAHRGWTSTEGLDNCHRLKEHSSSPWCRKEGYLCLILTLRDQGSTAMRSAGIHSWEGGMSENPFACMSHLWEGRGNAPHHLVLHSEETLCYEASALWRDLEHHFPPKVSKEAEV